MSLRRAAVWFTLFTAAAWALAGLGGELAGARDPWPNSSLAAAICLIPGWLVFALANRYRTSTMVGLVVVAGAALRGAFVLAGLFALWFSRGNLEAALLWVGAFYVLTLAAETGLLLNSGIVRGVSQKPPRVS